MASLIGRLFGRGRGDEPQAQSAGCYVCGQETGYRCSQCNKQICNSHTEPGTGMCVECAGEREAMRL